MKIFFMRMYGRDPWIFLVLAEDSDEAICLLREHFQDNSPCVSIASVDVPGCTRERGVIACCEGDAASFRLDNY